MKKINSFTLVEILVALAIGTLVILMAGSLYLSILRINNSTIKQYEQNKEVLNLYFVLKHEFSKSDLIYKKYNELVFNHVDLSKSILEFADDKVLYIRGDLKDTLYAACSSFEIKSLLEDGVNITYLKFDVKVRETILPMSFYKEYTSADYINKNIHPDGN